MISLPILKIGNLLLRKKCSAIPPKFFKSSDVRGFVKRMVHTMRAAQGVGLAANQVGKSRQMIVLECRQSVRYPGRKNFPLQVYLNPRLVSSSKKKSMDWEGCLSIPGYRGLVPRSRKIKLEAVTLDGKKICKSFDGFEARVLQHELDHLHGSFYIDRMRDFRSWMHLAEFNKKVKISRRILRKEG